MEQLQGRNAILTGASRGLGVHVARGLARQGVDLALAARSGDALEEVRKDVERVGVDAVAIPTDLSETAQIEALVRKAEGRLGPVDLLVNNAGVEHTAPYEESSPGRIEAAVKVNLLAPMLLVRAVLPGMLARRRGHIVNMSSLAGKVGFPGQTAYATTKAGLVVLTQSLRAELADEPVSVSAICPGFVAEAGMYARATGASADDSKLSTTTPAKVVSAVLDAIRKDRPELIVNPLPVRPVCALQQLFPGITPTIHRFFGTAALARTVHQGSDEGEGARPEA